METQRVFGEVPVRVDPTAPAVSSEQTVTLDDLLKVLKEIHRKAVGSGLSATNSKDNPEVDKLYKRLWEEFKDFAKEFPLIFRWTVQTMTYEERAFRAYIKKNHKAMWKDRKEMLIAQVQYLVYCYRIQHPRESAKALGAYSENVRKKVLEEQEQFEKAAKEAEEECEKNEKARTRRIREALMATAKKAAQARGDASAPPTDVGSARHEEDPSESS